MKTMRDQKPNIPAMRRNFDRANLESARLIVAAPDKYGVSSGLMQWAYAVIARLDTTNQ